MRVPQSAMKSYNAPSILTLGHISDTMTDDALDQTPAPDQAGAEDLDSRFRLIGILPLIFFAGQGIFYWFDGSLGNMLWMCNIGNLVLAIAIFAGAREVIRAIAIWTIPGLVIWFFFAFLPIGFVFTSALAHLGSLAVALVVLRKIRVDRMAWLFAFGWYLLMQAVARLATAPALNVNLAHRVQPGLESTFTSYWKFWLALAATVAAGLWLIGMVFKLIWPDRRVSEPIEPAA